MQFLYWLVTKPSFLVCSLQMIHITNIMTPLTGITFLRLHNTLVMMIMLMMVMIILMMLMVNFSVVRLTSESAWALFSEEMTRTNSHYHKARHIVARLSTWIESESVEMHYNRHRLYTGFKTRIKIENFYFKVWKISWKISAQYFTLLKCNEL